MRPHWRASRVVRHTVIGCEAGRGAVSSRGAQTRTPSGRSCQPRGETVCVLVKFFLPEIQSSERSRWRLKRGVRSRAVLRPVFLSVTRNLNQSAEARGTPVHGRRPFYLIRLIRLYLSVRYIQYGIFVLITSVITQEYLAVILQTSSPAACSRSLRHLPISRLLEVESQSTTRSCRENVRKTTSY
jgi:hypothetical protein